MKDITTKKLNVSSLCPKDSQHARSLKHFARKGFSCPCVVDQSRDAPERSGCFHLYIVSHAIVLDIFTSNLHNFF